jgi:nitroimidazol reductase NimA-like FMN-containing flavoprotein (pyridoxamine 5'-phosphate oxidase superfamily)
MKLKKAVASLIELERVCRVATVGKSAVPHLVPVCHVVSGGKIYFATEKSAQKLANLKQNARIAVTVDLYSDAWAALRGVMVQGTAKLIGRSARFRKIRSLLYRKYPQYAGQAPIGESDSVIVEVTPKHVFSWGIE